MEEGLMKLSVFGLGYVGCVSAACFSEAGHEGIGVDSNPLKGEGISGGRSPIVETGGGGLVAAPGKNRRARGETDVASAIAGSARSLGGVGPPRHSNGQ